LFSAFNNIYNHTAIFGIEATTVSLYLLTHSLYLLTRKLSKKKKRRRRRRRNDEKI
jgi:hypothetical protein